VKLDGIIEEGKYTTKDVLRVMSSYAHQDFQYLRRLAESIVANIHPQDTLSQAIAIRNWILNNLIYVRDHNEAKRLFNLQKPDLELVKSPRAVLESKRYDCDCIAAFIAAIGLALGIKSRFMAVAFHDRKITGPDGYSHVFAQFYDPSGNIWITIDPVSYPNEDQMMNDIRQYLVLEV